MGSETLVVVDSAILRYIDKSLGTLIWYVAIKNMIPEILEHLVRAFQS